ADARFVAFFLDANERVVGLLAEEDPAVLALPEPEAHANGLRPCPRAGSGYEASAQDAAPHERQYALYAEVERRCEEDSRNGKEDRNRAHFCDEYVAGKKRPHDAPDRAPGVNAAHGAPRVFADFEG